MKVTKHRDKILEALREWFRTHKQPPTLEELCVELGMKPSQKATVQKWLQSMRGIDVEWDDHVARSLRLLQEDFNQPEIEMSVKEIVRYLATGLVEWEKTDPKKRRQIPKALRLGMSGMYLKSLLQGDETAPSNLPEFFEWAASPVVNWSPAREIEHLSENVTLIEDGLVSDFATQWAVSGSDVERQVQEKVLEDVLLHCQREPNKLDDAYRGFRKLIITKPVLSYGEYRRFLSDSQLKPLREFLQQVYMDLVELAEEETYHFCPRCKYVKRKRPDGTYPCWNQWCDRLSTKKKLPPLPTISRKEAEKLKIVTPGVYRYGTLPGIYEIMLAEELSKLGIRVTLWPKIDRYDLLVEFSKKLRWAIDVKDWSYLDLDRLQTVNYQLETKETFVVFPDDRENNLRVKVVRQEIEPELKGVRLKLISEIIEQAKAILNKNKNHA
ncbi:MAG: hypothetical protein QNJ54_02455 [Prochloraceae cyanobacterium]|nr:hypothetical protein [Prochloraceae cyanobacterium]